MTLFEQCLAEAIEKREQQEKEYAEKKSVRQDQFGKLCQMTDLLTTKYRYRGMTDFYGAQLPKEQLKEQILSLGGSVCSQV